MGLCLSPRRICKLRLKISTDGAICRSWREASSEGQRQRSFTQILQLRWQEVICIVQIWEGKMSKVISILCCIAVCLGGIAVSTSAPAQSVSGKTFNLGNNGGKPTYHSNGQYTYVSPQGAASRGTWTQNGQNVCITFTNGRQRCDVIDFKARTLTNSSGQMYPF
jgi:YD repeat-containing protein